MIFITRLASKSPTSVVIDLENNCRLRQVQLFYSLSMKRQQCMLLFSHSFAQLFLQYHVRSTLLSRSPSPLQSTISYSKFTEASLLLRGKFCPTQCRLVHCHQATVVHRTTFQPFLKTKRKCSDGWSEESYSLSCSHMGVSMHCF